MSDIVSKTRVILGLRKGGFVVIRLDQLTRGAVDLHLEDVEARLELDVLRIKEVGGGAHDMELLALIDRVLSAQIRACGSGLDLDKYDLVPVAGNDVDLAELVFIILVENFVMLLFEMLSGELFTQRAEGLVGEWFHNDLMIDGVLFACERDNKESGRRGADPYTSVEFYLLYFA